MRKVISCKFSIDTACVETYFSDGTSISIYTPAIDATLDITNRQQAEVDWLIYNDPVSYTNLVLNGELGQYIKSVTGLHCLED